MKKALLPLLILLTTGKLFSQVYYLNNGFTNGGQVRNCAGSFKDSNPFGAYANNERYSVTFNTASSVNQAMQLDFDTLDLATGDTMYILDGTSVNAPRITALTNIDGAPVSVRATAANTSGSLTILFSSNNINVASGWNANLACKSPCQQIGVNLTTIPAADANGFINICKGSEVIFSGSGVYAQNNIFYHQSDTTAKFLWSFSDGKDTSGIFTRQIKRRFDNEGGTIVQLALVDENECYNLTATQVKIRTSLTPKFNISDKVVCVNDTTSLLAKLTYPQAIFSNLPVYSDKKPLADGVGKCYETSINITKFLPNQKLTNINDLDGILINMEHSWLGDFTIAITAPNGTKVYLKKLVGTTQGWESFLGEPVDEPSLNSALSSAAGKGYDYMFSPNPKYSTMDKEKGKYIYSYTDNAGQTQVNHTYLPAGSYASEEDLSALLGTTLNGLWTIEVCDNYKEDNGFIFYWTMKFKPSVYPDSEIYTTKLQTQQWLAATGLISAKDSVALIALSVAGNFNYKYSATDNFGCTADTIVVVKVNALPIKPNLGADTVLCAGQSLSLTVGNPQAGNVYNWSTGAANVTSTVIYQQGVYSVQTQNINGCKMADTVIVIKSAPFGIALQSDTLFCATSPNILTPVLSGNIASIKWSTGATTPSLTINKAGVYTVSGTTPSGCVASDTINMADNPVNLVNLPADTTVCAGTGFLLTLNGVSNGVNVRWGDGTTGSTHYISEGRYNILADYIGCSKTDELVAGRRPIPVVSLGSDTVLCTGFNLPLLASYPGATYLWNTGSTQNNIVARQPDLYWVQVNLNGCGYRDSLVMTQRPCTCNVVMPNAFSPNGDGINDVYQPQISCFPKDFKLSVFNRYGQLLFSTNNYQMLWNGTFKGNPLPVATYYYVTSFFNVDLQKTEQFKGSITLIR